jgi:hypothetical protein
VENTVERRILQKLGPLASLHIMIGGHSLPKMSINPFHQLRIGTIILIEVEDLHIPLFLHAPLHLEENLSFRFLLLIDGLSGISHHKKAIMPHFPLLIRGQKEKNVQLSLVQIL